jgi:flagellar FliJ protein
MEGYKFPLQKLLDIRIIKEDESKRDFMEAQGHKKIAEEKLAELKSNHRKFNVENKEEDIVTRKIRNSYITALNNHIIESTKELARRIEKVDMQREDLKQKQIDRKTVETLKEKRQELFKKEIDDKERKSNDEFALYSYMRKHERG